jgi:hypothetical protein
MQNTLKKISESSAAIVLAVIPATFVAFFLGILWAISAKAFNFGVMLVTYVLG